MKLSCFSLVLLFTTNMYIHSAQERVDIAAKEYDGGRCLPTGDAVQMLQLATVYAIIKDEFTKNKRDMFNATCASFEHAQPTFGLTMGSGFMFEVTDCKNVVRSFWGQGVVVDKLEWQYQYDRGEYDKGIIQRLGLRKLKDLRRPDFLYNGKYLITSIDGLKPAEPIVEEASFQEYPKDRRIKSWEDLKNYKRMNTVSILGKFEKLGLDAEEHKSQAKSKKKK